MTRYALCLSLLAALAAGPAAAQDPSPYAPDTPEPGSVDSIAAFTTAPQFLPASVAYVPDDPSVPSPRGVLGHLSGAPDELSSVAQVHGYFRKLAEASPRVQVRKIGTTVEGRDILLAIVSDRENLEALDRYRDITDRLSDPRRTDRATMESLVADGKVFYHFLGGLHSTETGPPEMLMELAYRLAVSEKPEIRAIRRNVIVLITPVMEPDGRDRVVQWYYRHLKGRDLPFRELDRFSSPPYWGHYAFHDNNRDGIQLTLPLTRAVNDTYWDFHPQVIHDLHESLPLLYISTGHGPYSDAVDPVTVNEWTQFAHHEASELEAMGLPGVWVWGFWDGWWPGYLFSVANNHNSIGRFYETFGNSMAGTFERDLSYEKFLGKSVLEKEWYRPWPPSKKKIMWSLRDNTNYMESGALQALNYASLHRRELLRNFWVKGNRALEKGKTEAPYAWIFPRDQRDTGRLAYLVNQLLAHHIEVGTLAADYTMGKKTFPAGSYVVRMDQPYRNAAVNFLEVQHFPEDEPNPPYDDVAWTLPLMYGVEGTRIDSAGVLETGATPVAGPVTPRGGVDGQGGAFLLRDTGQTAFLAARVMLGGARVEAAEDSFETGGVSYPPGSWIVRASREAVEKVASATGLTFAAVEKVPEVARHTVNLPRLAVYHTWTSTQDCGWMRYTLDRDHVPYTLINDDDLRKGGLRGRFDLIVYPNGWDGFAEMVQGIDPKYGPLAYTKTDRYPSHGIPDASKDITGGMGLAGLANVQRYLEDGGLFVAIGRSGQLLVESGIVRGVKQAKGGRTPGSVIRTRMERPRHPITYGYETLATAFRGNGPIWDVDKEDRARVVVQFGTKEVEDSGDESPDMMAGGGGEASNGDGPGGGEKAKHDTRVVLSGYGKGKAILDGKPAVLDVPVGKGRAILFSFNPMHRYLNHADFRYLTNVVLNWDDLPE